MKVKLPITLFFFFFLSCFLPAQSWQKLGGPFGGGSTVYPGKQGFLFMILGENELYRSADGGLNWQKMPATPANIWYWPLVIGADGNLFAGQSNKLYRSTDNGQSWSQISTISHETIYSLPGGEILISSYNGIQRSTNNGQSWSIVASNITGTTQFTHNPYTGDVYAWEDYVSSNGVGYLWRSTDHGLTWSVFYEAINLNPYQIAFSPTGGIFVGAEDLIWRSLDNGATWTSIDPIFQNSYRDVSVGVSPSGRLFAFEWYLSKYSDDNGNTWLPLEDSGHNALIGFSVSPDGTIFAQRDYSGSLQRSSDNGNSWQFSANGILKSNVMELQHIDETHLLALTSDGLFYSSNSGSTWQLKWEAVTSDPFLFGSHLLQVSPTGSWYLWDGFDLLKFSNEGQSHITLQIPGVNVNNFQGFWVSPINGKILAASYNELLNSADDGQTWTLSGPNFGFEGIVFMPDGSLLFSDYEGLYKSVDDGQTHVKISDRVFWPDPPSLSANGTLYGFNSGVNYSLAISPDGGLTWDSIPYAADFYYTSPIANVAGFVYANEEFNNLVMRSVDGGHSFNPLPIIGDGYNTIESISLNSAHYLFNCQSYDGIYRSTVPTTQVKLLTGSTYHDLDGTCSLSAPDSLLRGKVVKATQNGQNVFGYSNSAGQYLVPVSSGNYQVSVVPPNAYWASCGTSITIPNNNSIGIVDSAAVGLSIATSCPYAEVDVSAPFLRRCFESQIFVYYSNNGTLPANGAYLEITLDSLLEFNSSSLPVAAQNGNTYTFQLGNLTIGSQGNLTLNVTPSCNAGLGYIHCAKAHIYPDELCPPLSGARIVTTAVCLGDSVQLRIDNLGTADMDQPLNWQVIDVENFNDPFTSIISGEFQLAAGTHFSKNIASGYQRLDFYANQSPQYPFNVVSHTRIQGCGTAQGAIPLSIVNEDEEGPFVDKFCVRNIGAFDPNDKQGFPEGLTEHGYIERDQTLEYLIRFQNTGTDTAFNVSIRDTLTALLDPASIRLGASSHPCELKISPSGALQFIFEHILLPDSNINEVASHGFVQFTIAQKKDNPIGSTIRNHASIYFDFNPPVVTNATLHTVGIPLVTGTESAPEQLSVLSFSPNPFRESTMLNINGQAPDLPAYLYEMYDALGKIVQTGSFQQTSCLISRSQLPSGAYQLILKSTDGKVIGKGTIVAQ